MSGRPFQFVHASDLHLEAPAGGLADAPEQLRERLLECPYQAAARVFDITLAERAEFLVLAGDVLDPWTAGPRGVLFLIEQFKRLGEHGVRVFWAGGSIDSPEHWPAGVSLPENVHHFAKYRGETAGLFTVAVAYGEADSGALAHSDLDYWALGGQHSPATPFASRRVAHYCGSHQARDPDDTGAHGCTLVSVDADGQPRLTQRPADVLRFRNEHLELPETAGRQTLEALLDDRLLNIAASSPGVDLLISLTVGGASPALGQLRRGALAGEVLERLRKEYGHGSPSVWCASLVAEPPETLPPECYEHDSLLGDYLRAIRKLQIDESLPIELTEYLEGREHEEPLAHWPDLSDPGERRRVLRRAATLGIDLLTGEGAAT
jgi:exonuclease SbcD